VTASDPAEVSRAFFQAYADGDREAAASLLAEDVVAYVTNADAGVDTVNDREAYMARVPDLQEAGGSAEITQVVAVDDERALTMVEIRVPDRKGKSLHNHAAFLARVAGGEIAELWMVEALPAYSDEFWS
jgi:ketosteroid isomerase-like protein